MTEFDETNFEGLSEEEHSSDSQKIRHLTGMYEDYFIDYASYVILERAVPHITDGLKPVQRRILHAMKRLDDGRYNKVANIIGYTMQYHPHGDISIGDALVQLGQKDLLIDTQGNWGNIYTGDGAAASRYIEARLSGFASDVVFNPKTTEWKLSYDGRNKEPVTLPVKFPLLLAQGAEGIAVGLSSKILPHNFNELIDAAISYLQGKPFELYPDFPTGGLAEFTKYNDGQRGGLVRVRARIEKLDSKTLVIRDLPYGKTTTTLIDSIIKAAEKGKIKIRKIDDNTAEQVEILVHLGPNVSSDKTIDALYAFTDCEVPISPNCCVIEDDKPHFIGVSDVLRANIDHTLDLLKQELTIKLEELEQEWHTSTLEKIFIEKRIYRDIEECETWESVLETIDKGLDPYKNLLVRDVTRDDIIQLTEIKIKRISKYDSGKADEKIKAIEQEISEVKNHLGHLVEYTINYFRQIKKKHGKGRERKTEIRNFANIEATKVIYANQKLYVNRTDGFIGTGLKKDEYVCDCSDIDDIIVFLKDGTFIVNKVTDKQFIGKDIIHAAVFKKNDRRTIYNVIYFDGNSRNVIMKRAPVTGITREKEYHFIREHKNSKILYFSANPNGEAETVKVFLKPRARLKNTVFEFDFSELAIKGRDAMGNILTKHAVQKIVMKEKGISTLGGRKIWFDEDVARLNADARGRFLGEFSGEDTILVITRMGTFRVTNFDLSNHFEDDWLIVEKFRSGKIWSAVYYDAEQSYYYVKRFRIEPTEKPVNFIGEHPDSRLVRITEVEYPRLELKFGGKSKDRNPEIIEVADFIGVKSYRAKGRRLSKYEVKVVEELEPLKSRTVSAEAPGDGEAEDTPASAKAGGDGVTEDKPTSAKAGGDGVTEDKPASAKAVADGEGGSKKAKVKSKKESASAEDAKGGEIESEGKGSVSGEVAADKVNPDDIPFEIEGPVTETDETEGSPPSAPTRQAEAKKADKDREKPNGQMTFEW
ncbi:MAG: DNA gyrase/topoisomerase IV subunit A [Bacteroidales bacterium]|nr:DNA gyrase/topoisomerase IV subunit A [Bacteroidales bacterium]